MEDYGKSTAPGANKRSSSHDSSKSGLKLGVCAKCDHCMIMSYKSGDQALCLIRHVELVGEPIQACNKFATDDED